VGIQGISTESEAGLNRIGELVDLLVDREVGAVFVESSVSDRNIRALIEGAAARGHEVASGASFIPTRWGNGDLRGDLYRHDRPQRDRDRRALGGEVPERGMDGRLAGF
jgi:manganese/zinc/iron transport system substrate-binding protein